MVLVMVGMNNKHSPQGSTFRALMDAGYVKLSTSDRILQWFHRVLWISALDRLVRWSLDPPYSPPTGLPAVLPAPLADTRHLYQGRRSCREPSMDPRLKEALAEADRAEQAEDRLCDAKLAAACSHTFLERM